MSTGAQIRPIRSRRVGATNLGSVVCTITSLSSSVGSGVADPGRGGAGFDTGVAAFGKAVRASALAEPGTLVSAGFVAAGSGPGRAVTSMKTHISTVTWRGT